MDLVHQKEQMQSRRPQVLQAGPDTPGGMTTMIEGLFRSPLADLYQLEMVATHRGPCGFLQRLLIFSAALCRLIWWSLRDKGRIVHVHVTVRGSMYRKAVFVLAAKMLRRRVILHVHSGPGDIAAFRDDLDDVSAALFRFVLRRSDALLAVSRASAAALMEAYDSGEILVVPNAAPTNTFEREPVATPRNEPPLALYLGGFGNPVKGGKMLLDALEVPELTGLSVVMAGPGELPEAGSQLIARRGEVEWRGWLEPGDRDALMREADIFVLPATSEGLPLALLEAMAVGLGIVATKVGGIPDVLTDNRDALLVDPGDPLSLAAALSRLANDAKLRRQLGEAARERSLRLSAEEVTGRLDDLYTQLLR